MRDSHAISFISELKIISYPGMRIYRFGGDMTPPTQHLAPAPRRFDVGLECVRAVAAGSGVAGDDLAEVA